MIQLILQIDNPSILSHLQAVLKAIKGVQVLGLTNTDVTTIDENEEAAEACASLVSKDLLLQVGEYALEESRAGRCIPHAKAMNMIKQRMGWK